MLLEDIARSFSVTQDLDKALEMFDQDHVLKGLLFLGEKTDLYVVPCKPESGAFQEGALAFLERSLGDLEPRRTEYHGFVAFEINNGGGRPTAFTYNIGTTVEFRFKVVRETPTKETSVSHQEKVASTYDILGTTGQTLEITLGTSHKKYRLIPTRQANRHYFPGYKIGFQLKDGNKLITTHITAATRGYPNVGTLEGTYASKGISQLYKAHPELNGASTLLLEIVEPGKMYSYKGCK